MTNHLDRTSYETSKRLKELGYYGPNDGWWSSNGEAWSQSGLDEVNYSRPGERELLAYVKDGGYKSYNSFQLLLALQKEDYKLYPFFDEDLGKDVTIVLVEENYNLMAQHENPCEAMGLALCKVLESKND